MEDKTPLTQAQRDAIKKMYESLERHLKVLNSLEYVEDVVEHLDKDNEEVDTAIKDIEREFPSIK